MILDLSLAGSVCKAILLGCRFMYGLRFDDQQVSSSLCDDTAS